MTKYTGQSITTKPEDRGLKFAGWKYSMFREDGTVSIELVKNKSPVGQTPWGKRGIHFDDSYKVTCEKLFTVAENINSTPEIPDNSINSDSLAGGVALEAPPPRPWHEKAAITLTCGMLLEAYNFGTGDGDPENHGQEMSIGYLKHELANDDPAGYYAWCTDYPEEGAIILTGDSALSKTIPSSTSPAPAEWLTDDVLWKAFIHMTQKADFTRYSYENYSAFKQSVLVVGRCILTRQTQGALDE